MAVVDSVSDTANSLFSSLNTYAATHHDGIVALLLLTGVTITFTGRKLLKPTVFLLGFIPATLFIAAIGVAFSYDQPIHQPWLDALAIAISLLFGVLIGFIMLRLLFRIATFLICAGFGAVLVLVTHLFILQPTTGQNAQFLLYAAVIFAAIVAGLLSVSYPDTGIILGTAFDGAALAVFSLARFLGHRPHVLSEQVNAADVPPWWAVGYGAATLLLGLFGAITQRQVANADAVVASLTKQTPSGYGGSEQGSLPFLPGEETHLLPFEPPRTPPHLRSGIPSPDRNSEYGAVDQEDPQYSVVHNLGAGPLTPSVDVNTYKNSKDSNGPLPL